MNYCRKCQSDYEKPGTCNCFAPQAATPQWSPFYPNYTPWWVQTPTGTGTPITTGGITFDNTCGGNC